MLLFNCNRETGLLSDFSNIQVFDTANAVSGLAFSPNSKVIYVTAEFDLHQIEIATGEIMHIANVGKHVCGDSLRQIATFWNMALGPYCRIYIDTTSTQQCYQVIPNPDNKGVACNFKLGGISLLYKNTLGMANFPHYRVGEAYPCDSTKKLFTYVERKAFDPDFTL